MKRVRAQNRAQADVEALRQKPLPESSEAWAKETEAYWMELDLADMILGGEFDPEPEQKQSKEG